MDRRFEYLELLIESLGALQDALDGDCQQLGNQEDPSMLTCEQAFERFKVELERHGAGERSPELKARIQHAAKLHALVISAASQAKGKIGEDLAGSANRKQFRDALKAPAVLGGSCDMAG